MVVDDQYGNGHGGPDAGGWKSTLHGTCQDGAGLSSPDLGNSTLDDLEIAAAAKNFNIHSPFRHGMAMASWLGRRRKLAAIRTHRQH